MTAHVTISDYGRSTRTVCTACEHDHQHGKDHRGAALEAAEHNSTNHTTETV